MRARSRVNLAAYLWGALGVAGSVVLTLAGTRLLGPRAGGQQLLGPGPVRWWFQTQLVSGTVGTEVIFYAGVAALVIAWVGLGFQLRRPGALGMRTLVVIGALWCLPLALGPPLFSRDVYSYIAQGTLLHLGHNPYQVTPLTLSHLGQQHILNAVSHTWLRTTAPYGPLFLLVVGWLVAAAGYKLVLAAILVRLLAILGVALLIAALPPLARRVGGDPRRAVWLIALSPLVLFQLVSPGHNDILMAGVMAVGVAAALRWPLLGIAICALAATIKVPAAAGAAFIAVAWAWNTQGNWNRARVLAQSAIVFAAVLAVISVGTGVGVSWVSGGLFSTPGKVHLAITPATALGYTTATLLRDAGVGVGGHTLAAIFARVDVRPHRRVRALAALSLAEPHARALPRRAACGGCRFRPGSLALVPLLGSRTARRMPQGAAMACDPGSAGGRRRSGGTQRDPAAFDWSGAVCSRRVRDDRDLCCRIRAQAAPCTARRRPAYRGRGGVARAVGIANGPRHEQRDRHRHNGDGRDRPRPRPAKDRRLRPWWPAGDRRVGDAAVVAIPALLAGAVCLVDITARSLGFDESATASIVSEHGAALSHAISHDGGNMAGYYVLMHALVSVFGRGMLVLRLPSAIAIAVAVAVTGLLGLRLFGRRAALVAGLLTAVSVSLVFWGQGARSYALLVAFSCASFLAFVALVQPRDDVAGGGDPKALAASRSSLGSRTSSSPRSRST